MVVMLCARAALPRPIVAAVANKKSVIMNDSVYGLSGDGFDSHLGHFFLRYLPVESAVNIIVS